MGPRIFRGSLFSKSKVMKKVIMLRSIAGDDWKLGKGAEVELEDEVAVGWESANVCRIIEDSYAKKVEHFHIPVKHDTMEKGPDETAVKLHAPGPKKVEVRKKVAAPQKKAASKTPAKKK